MVVQQQIDSEVAGVGFSLNPLTNDYDEAVFDANWGLGESVVAGLVSPDHFIVDKVSRQVVDKGSALHVMLMDLVDREPNYGYAFWLRK